MSDIRLRKAKSIPADKVMKMTSTVSPKIKLAAQRILLEAGKIPRIYSKETAEIIENAYTVLGLNSSFEEYFSIISGEYSLCEQVFDACGFIKGFCEEVGPHLNRLGIAFAFDVPAESHPAKLDRERLETCLLHIVKNSVKYTCPGNKIFIQLLYTKRYMKIIVRDKGVGMCADVLEHCCEPFFTRGGPNSMGLGLALAKYFVTESGGKLVIRSEPDFGAAVEIRFPIYKAEEDAKLGARLDGMGERDAELIRSAFLSGL